LISSEDVEGTEVYGSGDEVIGEIDHLLIEKVAGRVAYAVMSFAQNKTGQPRWEIDPFGKGGCGGRI
jgi:hypothetical protein